MSSTTSSPCWLRVLKRAHGARGVGAVRSQTQCLLYGRNCAPGMDPHRDQQRVTRLTDEENGGQRGSRAQGHTARERKSHRANPGPSQRPHSLQKVLLPLRGPQPSGAQGPTVTCFLSGFVPKFRSILNLRMTGTEVKVPYYGDRSSRPKEHTSRV